MKPRINIIRINILKNDERKLLSDKIYEEQRLKLDTLNTLNALE